MAVTAPPLSNSPNQSPILDVFLTFGGKVERRSRGETVAYDACPNNSNQMN